MQSNSMKWKNPKTGGWEICDIVLPDEFDGSNPLAVRRSGCTLVRCVLTGRLTWVPNEELSVYLGDRTPTLQQA